MAAMGDQTKISWCDHTFNPVWGCTKVSPGCANCYAERLARRFSKKRLWTPNGARARQSVKYWDQLERWDRLAAKSRKRCRVFVGSMCDLFEDHPVVALERQRLWRAIRQTGWLDYLLLTKRRITSDFLPGDWGIGWSEAWLGTSIENNDYAWRADALREIPAAVRFISYEPALGPIDQINLTGIDWVIAGGESGPGHRPDDPQWFRELRDHCRATGVKFFFKQRSGPRPGMGDLDGELIREFPC